MKRKQKKRLVSYESFIVGALLNFSSIDNVDFSLLVEDFKKKNNIELSGKWNESPNGLARYYKFKGNGVLSLLNGISLDDYLESDKCTLRKKFEGIAGKEVLDYFNSINVQKYCALKEEALLNNKRNVLDNANVLLISDIPEDYEEIRKYGFKRVDCFKSIVIADKYFSKHPDELQKYHIILMGRQRVQDCSSYGYTSLDDKIRKSNDSYRLIANLNCNSKRFNSFLDDYYNKKSWKDEEDSYTGIFDRIVENTFINHTMRNIGPKDYTPIVDSINPNRLPLPKKKSDLRILYLEHGSVNKYAQDIAKRLGLNITFFPDNHFSLGKNVKEHLGDYDIIIASDSFSRGILRMADESTEQCKDSGRELTLLATYDDSPIAQFNEDDVRDSDGIGTSVIFSYIYGGNFAPDSTIHTNQFNVLRKTAGIMSQEDAKNKYFGSIVSCMPGIISAAVNAYNNALLEKKQSPIVDIDLATPKEFDKEYDLAEKEFVARKEKALEPIKRFDGIRNAVSSYLYYKKAGLIEEPEGLKITERITDGIARITVENIYFGNTYCTITFPYSYRYDNLRVFDIQTLSKKGKLSNPEKVGVYTQ